MVAVQPSFLLIIGRTTRTWCAIGVEDLAVTADGVQTYLVQRLDRHRLVTRISHVTATLVQGPLLARFIAGARSVVVQALRRERTAHPAYLPRNRYRSAGSAEGLT